jgi:hypothetical protein
MTMQQLLGTLLIIAGLAGYISGVYIAYPGRAFSIAALMVGIVLTTISSFSSEGTV